MGRGGLRKVQRSWESEYRAGRFSDEGPVPFIDDIVHWGKELDLMKEPALYIGCGNGRNFIPLVRRGWEDLTGLDLSSTAARGLRARLQPLPARLIVGDLDSIHPTTKFGTVIGIQVFQHGMREQAHDHIDRAMRLVRPGGLFCLRVNSTETDIEFKHELKEISADGTYTIRYLDGPKSGLDIHFFSEMEVRRLLARGFSSLLEPRIMATVREAGRGRWSQWEAIARRNGATT